MTIGDRIKMILTELNLKQVDFAVEMGVSANYVNQLVNSKKENISVTLAKLIEKTYGYSAHWIITGEGQGKSQLSVLKTNLINSIQGMPDDEVTALLAFAHALDEVKKSLSVENVNE